MANFPGDPGLPLGSPVIAQSRGGSLVTTSLSGSTAERDGQAFKMSDLGSVLTDLHEFVTNDGEVVAGGLTLGRDGLFYGSALFNGPNNGGTVFQMTAGGNVTVLHSFSEPGGNPQAAPVQSLYGDFYGTTYGNDNDPNSDPGTIYKVDSAGNFTLLHTLSDYTEGANPSAPLVQDASNFWFYGVTERQRTKQRGIHLLRRRFQRRFPGSPSLQLRRRRISRIPDPGQRWKLLRLDLSRRSV